MFANFLLADEINRAPAKVQSALLEVMQERQVTIAGDDATRVPEPFLVLATQNPIESEGTYPLPEAQLDRFMLKVLVDYPAPTDELEVVHGASSGPPRSPRSSPLDRLRGLQECGRRRLRRPRGQRIRRAARAIATPTGRARSRRARSGWSPSVQARAGRSA